MIYDYIVLILFHQNPINMIIFHKDQTTFRTENSEHLLRSIAGTKTLGWC